MDNEKDRKNITKMWLKCNTFRDMCKLMGSTYKKHGTPIYYGKLDTESNSIIDKLDTINKLNAMISGSQPGIKKLNCIDDDCKYISQKAYLRMFVHKDLANKLYEHLKNNYIIVVIHDKNIIHANFTKYRYHVTYQYMTDGTIKNPLEYVQIILGIRVYFHNGKII